MSRNTPGGADNAYVGRDARGRIVLDVTSYENPACSLRFLMTPADADRLADELAEAASDDAMNMVAYTPDERGLPR